MHVIYCAVIADHSVLFKIKQTLAFGLFMKNTLNNKAQEIWKARQ